MRYTREQLFELPLGVVRGLNIETPEEEALVQEVVSQRVRDLPFQDPNPSSSLKTDNLTPELEAKLQAEIDAKRGAQAEPVAEEVSQETEEPTPEPVAEEEKPFCDTCDAKGPVKHKKECPKNA